MRIGNIIKIQLIEMYCYPLRVHEILPGLVDRICNENQKNKKIKLLRINQLLQGLIEGKKY